VTNLNIEVSPDESVSCLVLGHSETMNLKLLQAMCRMPSRWIVIGAPSPEIDVVLEQVGRQAFELYDASTQAPTGRNVVLFDGRRAA
jgi:hypothetical protein